MKCLAVPKKDYAANFMIMQSTLGVAPRFTFVALLVHLSCMSAIQAKLLPPISTASIKREQSDGRRGQRTAAAFFEETNVFSGGRSRVNRLSRDAGGGRTNFAGDAESAVSQDCLLSEAEVQKSYDRASKTWTLTDETLRQNGRDVQLFVDCSVEDDILRFLTHSPVQPRRRIVIQKRITLEGALIENGARKEEERHSMPQVSFTCSSELEGIFAIQSAGVVVKNLIVEDCMLERSSAVVLSKCRTDRGWDPVVFSNLIFRRNSNLNGPTVLVVEDSSCPSLSLEDVHLRSNTCFQNTAALHVKGMDFSMTRLVASNNRCQVLHISDSYVSLSQSRFIENSGGRLSDGIVRAMHSVLSIRECQFIKNSATQAGALSFVEGVVAKIEASDFHGNSAGGSGGAIALRHSTLNGSEINAWNNTAAGGGGFMMASWGRIDIRNSSFAKHSSTQGGAFSTLNSTFTGQYLTLQDNKASGTGGGLLVFGGLTTLSHTVMKRNIGAYAGGGALSGANARITGEHLHVVKNRALGNGGGGIETQGVHLQLSDSVFSSNQGPSGGALRVHGGTTEASRVTLEKNKATMRGGAIFSDSCHVDFQSSKLFKNVAMEGGAVYSKRGMFNGTEIRVVANHATLNGGGVYFISSKAILLSSLFENNTALYGGAVHALSSQFSGRVLTFRRNAAELDGGGFFMYHGNAFLSESTFQGNKAGKKGDKAITTKQSKVQLEHVKIEE